MQRPRSGHLGDRPEGVRVEVRVGTVDVMILNLVSCTVGVAVSAHHEGEGLAVEAGQLDGRERR